MQPNKGEQALKILELTHRNFVIFLSVQKTGENDFDQTLIERQEVDHQDPGKLNIPPNTFRFFFYKERRLIVEDDEKQQVTFDEQFQDGIPHETSYYCGVTVWTLPEIEKLAKTKTALTEIRDKMIRESAEKVIINADPLVFVLVSKSDQPHRTLPQDTLITELNTYENADGDSDCEDADATEDDDDSTDHTEDTTRQGQPPGSNNPPPTGNLN